MSDKENTTTPDAPDTAAPQTETKSSCPSCAGAGCNHLPLIVAFIALLLAAYAVISNQGNVSSGALDARLQQLDEQLAGMNQRIDSMASDVASNRENLVNTRLRKLLINIQEISSMAAEETRDRLAQVESLLQDITNPATEPATPEAEQTAPETDSGTSAGATDEHQPDSTDIPSVELQVPDDNNTAAPTDATGGDTSL